MSRLSVLVLVLSVLAAAVFASGGQEGAASTQSGPLQGTVKWFTHASVSQGELYNTWIQKYETKNPNVKVELTILTGWDEIWRKILTGVAAGEPPTGARIKDYMVRDLARRNALMDFTSYYERDRKEMEVDDLFDSLVNPYRIEGGTYGLPWHVYYYITYYNVDMVKDAGFNEAPQSWEEVRAIGKKVTNPATNTYGTQMMTYGGTDAFMTKTMEMFARAMAADPQKDPWDVDADIPEFNLSTSSMRKSVQMWLDFMYKDKIALPPELSKMPQRVENGLIAVWFNSQLGASELRTRTKINYQIALMPKGPRRTTVVEQNGWAVFANTGNDRLTWDFSKFVTAPDQNVAYCTDGVYMPTRRTYWDQAPFNSDPYYLVAREQLAHPDTVVHKKYTDDWMKVMVPISTELENIFYQKKTLDQGLKDAETAAKAALKEIYGK